MWTRSGRRPRSCEGVDVYKQDAPGEGPQAPDDGPAPGSDDTVEGEYREV